MGLIDGVVGLWHLNNDWQDSSGHGLHGTPSGPTFSTLPPVLGSHQGQFDAVDDYVSIPDNPILRLSTDITIALWTSLFSLKKRAFLDKGNQSYMVYINTSNKFCLGKNNAWETASNQAITTLNQKYCLIARRAAGITDLYINNVLDKKRVGDTDFSPTVSTLYMAYNQYAGGSAWAIDGLADEMCIWDRALTDGEISEGQAAGGEIAEFWNNGNGIEIGAAVESRRTRQMRSTFFR